MFKTQLFILFSFYLRSSSFSCFFLWEKNMYALETKRPPKFTTLQGTESDIQRHPGKAQPFFFVWQHVSSFCLVRFQLVAKSKNLSKAFERCRCFYQLLDIFITSLSFWWDWKKWPAISWNILSLNISWRRVGHTVLGETTDPDLGHRHGTNRNKKDLDKNIVCNVIQLIQCNNIGQKNEVCRWSHVRELNHVQNCKMQKSAQGIQGHGRLWWCPSKFLHARNLSCRNIG